MNIKSFFKQKTKLFHRVHILVLPTVKQKAKTSVM